MNKENTVRQAGGFIIQLMPGAEDELIDRLAEESGLSKEYITNESEYASHSSWTAVTFSSVRSFGVPSNQDYLWAIQRRIILELGQKENCVIVGRCADAILEDTADLLKVFVHADFEKRAKRIVEKYGETEEPTEKRLRDKDKRRALYYQFYTDLEWGNMNHYHIILDSGALGIENHSSMELFSRALSFYVCVLLCFAATAIAFVVKKQHRKKRTEVEK